MNTKAFLVVFSVVCVGVAVAFYLSGDSDKDAVIARIAEFGETVSSLSSEKSLTRAVNARNLSEMLTDPCTIELPGTPLSGVYDRKKASALAMQAGIRFRRIGLRLQNVRVRVEAGDRAYATLTAVFDAATASGGLIEDAREIDCELVKIEREWLFTSCRPAGSRQ